MFCIATLSSEGYIPGTITAAIAFGLMLLMIIIMCIGNYLKAKEKREVVEKFRKGKVSTPAPTKN